MIQAVAQRLALSVDNARLFEQTQELAQQELEVNTISARIQGLTDTDDLVRTVIQELSRALGAERATVRLGAPAGLGSSGNGNGARRS
jgi:GAF domain-containing protein